MDDIKFKAVIGNKYCFHGKALTLKQISKLGDSFFQGDVKWLLYTGWKDKKDNEIYNGDIGRDEGGNICRIFWNNNSSGFDADFPQADMFSVAEVASLIEIIGNIYSNPELLKK